MRQAAKMYRRIFLSLIGGKKTGTNGTRNKNLH